MRRTSLSSLPGPILLLLVLGGCLFTDGEPCGPYMSLAGDVCVCVAGSISVTGGCEPCAADEVVADNTCGCATGLVKNAEGMCALVSGLGDACDLTAPCENPAYAYCDAPAGSTAGSCTNTCASDADCGADYTCATWEATPYCRQYSGLGMTCTSHADCAGLEAGGCDTFITHACVVGGCSVDVGDCPRDTRCCDLGAFGAGTACLAGCP